MQVYVVTPAVHEWVLKQAKVQVIATIEEAKRMMGDEAVILPERYSAHDVLVMLRAKPQQYDQRRVLINRLGGEERWCELLYDYRDIHLECRGIARKKLYKTILTIRAEYQEFKHAARVVGYSVRHLYRYERDLAPMLADWLNTSIL